MFKVFANNFIRRGQEIGKTSFPTKMPKNLIAQYAGVAVLGGFLANEMLKEFHPSKYTTSYKPNLQNLIKKTTEIYLKGLPLESLESNILDPSISENTLLENTLFEEFIEKITHDPSKITTYLREYSVQGQTALIELALKIADKDLWLLANNIDKFGIKNQATLIELAHKAADENLRLLAQNIDKFRITDQAALIELSFKIADKEPSALAKNIDKFGIKNQATLIELAHKAADENLRLLAQNIDKFRITDQAALIELSFKIADKEPSALAKNIDKFGITDQATLIELAFKMVDKEPWTLAENIDKFRITDQTNLIKLALKIANEKLSLLAQNIDKFKITDQATLIKLALKIADEDLWALAQNIDKFGIKNQATLIELAFKIADEDLWALAQNIDKFGIKDQAILIELAFKMVDKAPWALTQNIDKFKITDQATLIKLALKIADEDLRLLAQNIDKFKITDQTALIRLALKIADKQAWALAKNIDKFGIKDQATLIELALKIADEDLWALAENIDKFRITDQNTLKEIVFKIADKSPWALAYNIAKFGITDQATLIKLFLKIADKDPWALAKNIDKFGITDQAILIKLSLKIADKDLLALAYNIDKLGITDQTLLSELGYKMSPIIFREIAREIFIYSNEDWQEICTLLKTFYSKTPEHLSNRNEQLLFYLKNERSSLFLDKNYDFVLENILAYRGRDMISFLLAIFIQEGGSIEFQQTYDNLIAFSKDSSSLVAILPAKWMEKQSTSLKELTTKNLSTSFKRWESLLKEPKSPLKIALLNAEQLLEKTTVFSDAEKLSILSNICSSSQDPSQILKGLRLVIYFIGVEKEDILKQIPSQFTVEDLEKAFQKAISSQFNLPSLTNQEIADRYEQTFGTLRVAYGLEIFSKIHQNSELSVRKSLERFKESVMLETFEVERFRTDNNPHLKQIQDADPNLFNAWKALSFERTLEAHTKSSQDFSFTDFLKEKFHDGHFTQESLPILAQFLTSQNVLQEQKDPEFASAQKECIELMQSSPSQEILLQKLPKIIAILEKKSPSLELINDLKTLIHSLHPHKHQKETVVFTKKWQDLFVAGSELGSCQRLDGSADLNKCLLAYCLDGKNGMIAVQDEIGTTVARAILRLLLDPSTNKPTLFLERLYPNPISSHRQKAILDAAKECAKTLGCKVFILSDDTSGTKLISKGSSCPYEYVDASGGVKKEGIFSVYGKELT